MKLSTRTRYAARALTELALAYPDTAVPIRDMADRQNISPKYLEQIMHILKVSGLVQSVRGMHGGYVLTRPPATVTLDEVFETLEGTLAPVPCVDHPESCSLANICPTRETWVELRECIRRFLKRTSLKHLAERKVLKAELSHPMYNI